MHFKGYHGYQYHGVCSRWKVETTTGKRQSTCHTLLVPGQEASEKAWQIASANVVDASSPPVKIVLVTAGDQSTVLAVPIPRFLRDLSEGELH